MRFIDSFSLVAFVNSAVALGAAFVLGTLIGCLIISVLRNGCVHAGIPNAIQEIVIGVIIVVAVTLDRQDRSEEALEHFHEAVRLKPDYADAHANLGAILEQLGDLPAAQASAREALRIDPRHIPAFADLVSMLEGRLPDAGRLPARAMLPGDTARAARYSLPGARL